MDANARTANDARRAKWTRGLTWIGGSAFGLLFDWEALVPALRHRPYAYGSPSALTEIASLIGSFVLPLVVTFLAPRKSFLWAAAALGVQTAWSLLDRIVALNGPGLIHDFLENGGVALAALLILCGPVSLVRLFLRRHFDGKTRRIAAQQATMRQAAEDQAGVWPPPIRTDRHNP